MPITPEAVANESLLEMPIKDRIQVIIGQLRILYVCIPCKEKFGPDYDIHCAITALENVWAELDQARLN